MRKQAARWLQQLDTDAQLAMALRDAGKVVLAAPSAPGGTSTSAPVPERFALATATPEAPWYITAWRRLCSGRTLMRPDVVLPAKTFSDRASSIGFAATFSHSQQVQGIPLVIAADGKFLPSFELALLAAAQGRDLRAFSVDPQTAVLSGGNAGFGAPAFTWYPRPATAPPVYSLNDVMATDALARRLRGKTVVLGLTAPGLTPELSGPGGHSYTPVTWSAQLLDSMLAGNAFVMPAWFFAAQRGALVLLALYLLLLQGAGWGGADCLPPSCWARCC